MGSFARCAAVAAAITLATSAAGAQERIQAGTLACDISGGIGLIIGSQRTLNCSFTPSLPGPVEFYVGTLTKFGVDLGITGGGSMVWFVYAPTNRAAGALAGSYTGASAEASVVTGIGANV